MKTSHNTRSRIVSKNFYIFVSLKSRKLLNNEQWNVKKIFIDSKNILNLISQWIANQIEVIVRSDNFMTMIIVNEARMFLSEYIILKIIVTKMT